MKLVCYLNGNLATSYSSGHGIDQSKSIYAIDTIPEFVYVTHSISRQRIQRPILGPAYLITPATLTP